jgi:diketogulonate reductase-like aldo/keto reductase
MTKKIESTVTLNNGIEIPLFGLGLYLAGSDQKVRQAIHHALEVGYRLFDTASMYDNEEAVGKAIRDAGIPRENLFVTTKLWNSDQGYDRALKAFDGSLKRLAMDYVDLYLIHWPVEGLRKDSWRALETLYQEKRCRAIGVSNYTISHLEELLGEAEIPPTVNQVEFSPFLYQKDLLDFCRKHRIQLESYSPLTRGKKFNHPVLREIAAKYNKTPAQILIRWNLEHDIVVIPKSSNPARISENARIFDFSIDSKDMEKLDQLDQNYRVSWNPSGVK